MVKIKLDVDSNIENALDEIQTNSSLRIRGKGKLIRLYHTLLRDLGNQVYKQGLVHSEELIGIIKQLPQYPHTSNPGEGRIHDLRHTLMVAFNQTIYSIRGVYLPDDEIRLSNFVDGCVEFVEKIEDKTFPGFEVDDGRGGRIKCLIRYRKTLRKNEKEKLCITGIDKRRGLIYLDPRLEEGDTIWVVVKDIAHGGKGDPRFRFMKYDGFLKDYDGIEPRVNGFYKTGVIYYRKRVILGDVDGHVKSVGLIFAKPIEDLTGKITQQDMGKYRNEIIRKN